MKRGCRGGLLGLASAVLLLAGSPVAQAEVKFGALFPLSGGLALLGEESYRGVQLAVQEINANGGVQGEEVVLETGDAVDPNQAIAEARRLMSVENVRAIFGTYSSSRSIAASQVAEIQGVPYFELGAVADKITGRGFKYVHRTNPAAEQLGNMTIELITEVVAPKLGVEPQSLRIGIIHEDSNYGSSVSRHQIGKAEELGLNIVENEGYSANTVDMSSIVLRLKESDVDVVLQTSYQNDSVLFLQQANEGGFAPEAIIGGGGGYSMQPTADAVGHGVIQNVLDVDFTQFTVDDDAAPGNAAFVKAYKERFGSAPRSGHSLNHYVGAKAILQAIDNADGFDSETIIQAAESIDIKKGETAAGYGIKFDETGQNARAFMMGFQWQEGKLITVYPPEFAMAEPGL